MGTGLEFRLPGDPERPLVGIRGFAFCQVESDFPFLFLTLFKKYSLIQCHNSHACATPDRHFSISQSIEG